MKAETITIKTETETVTRNKTIEFCIPDENLACYLEIYSYIKNLLQSLKKNPPAAPDKKFSEMYETLSGWVNTGLIDKESQYNIMAEVIKGFALNGGYGKWKIYKKLTNADPLGRKVDFPIPPELMRTMTKEIVATKRGKKGPKLNLALIFLVHALIYDLKFYERVKHQDLYHLGKMIAVFFNNSPDIEKPTSRETGQDHVTRDEISDYTSKHVIDFYKRVSEEDMLLYVKYAMYYDAKKFKEAVPVDIFPYSGYLTDLIIFEIWGGDVDEQKTILPPHYKTAYPVPNYFVSYNKSSRKLDKIPVSCAPYGFAEVYSTGGDKQKR